ncbi:MAG: substrate-binding domain-containing protein [Candidatus Competibacter sp.]|nr:substrate-binding domain-containing protein [Candidatus Competibacter sp.]MDG4584671.1 substrate-binding domain-containing protein [Candidatus Competibacter sp.]
MNNPSHRLLSLMLLCLIAWAPSSPGYAQLDTNKDKIALVLKALSNPFFSKMEVGAKDYARDNGVTLEVFGAEMETDLERQIGIVDNLVSRGYGAIVIAPVDSRKLVPPLRKAVDRGIVVINIDNPLDQDTQAQYGIAIPFVGSDNAKGATLVGEYFRRKLHGKGRVIVIEGAGGAQNGELRKRGFRRAVTAGGGIEIVDSVSANWQTEDAFARMSDLLEKQGAVNAVFCANDQMALGVLQALDSRNLTGKVLVGGYDHIEAVRNELRNGRMHATVEQHPEQMGRYGVALALRAMQGQKIPIHQEVPLDLITYESYR